MNRAIVLLAGFSVLATSGVVHGLWTDRWTVSRALETAAARLDGVPRTVGDWEGKAQELAAEEVAGAGAAGWRALRYENRRKGQAVTVFLLCGRPGPISVHTPDVCYAGAGYESAAGPAPFAFKPADAAAEAGFQTATFRKGGASAPSELRIFWAWNAAGRWEAPGNPRWTFARYPALYKLYVVRETRPKESGRLSDDPCVAFLDAFLPELDRVLFPTP